MAVAHTHACFTTASFHHENWHDVEPLIESWKALLQGLPGFVACELWIRRLSNGDVHCIIQVVFEHREQLEGFLNSQWTPQQVISSLDPAPYDIVIDHFEQHI